ncbi:hypothetical protein Btru_068156 [Bulinus truncatus]|nr:hypothetical protein Btru_068156 [Bulinus truncatus]
MERLSTQSLAQDANACIAMCYQLNQPLNVQSVDPQTAVAVQSLLDSQANSENQEEDEDIFQCGKCKKQFTSLTVFVKHKQTQCSLQQQLQQQQIQLSQPQQQQLTVRGSPNIISPTINLNHPFSHLTGGMPTISTSAPILQAHPCLTRTLNQPSNAATLTLSGMSSSSISHLSQNMVFTDDLMSLANIDPSSLNGQTIQMVTGPVQSTNTSNGVTIFSPITSLAATGNSFTSPPGVPTGQLLVQPAQHITLTTITDKAVQQQFQHQQQQQQQLQPIAQNMPPITQSTHHQPSITITQTTQPHQTNQGFKASPTKAGRKSQNSFISVLNPDNSGHLLSTRKGKSARNTKNTEVSEEETNAKPKLLCTYCNKQFTKNFDLQQHIRAHTGEKPFQCIVCGRAFAQKSNVKKHMATHKVWPSGTSNTLPKQPEPLLEEKDLISSSCSSSPSSSIVATMAAIPPPQLPEASIKMFTSEVQQFNGLNKTEEEEEETPKGKVVVDNSYICQYCPEKFKTYYQLKTHLVNHKNEQVYKCVMKSCGQSFHDLDTFLEHVKSHENEMTYRCHQCHKYFKTLYDLGVHQYSHIYMNQGVKSGLRHFQCTKCGNKYTTPEALEHHMSTTSHDYKCPHCSKQFTCERFLRRHLPIHGSEGQFECQQCKKKFKTEYYLKSHILIHTGETPFICDICQAAFNRKDKLKRHMTIHDLVKKYRCPFRSLAGCLKEFNRQDKLKAHIVTHSGIKPFKCSICDKGFSRRPHLVEHERGHKLDYRFKCEKCGKGYFRPKLFNEHKCQPSKSGADQQFRPRNRRKVGRPRKRMISIAPDSLSKSRGKQYPSRTRLKGKIQQLTLAEELSGKQFQQDKMYQKLDSNDEDNKKYEDSNMLSVEVVKALPLVTSTRNVQSVVSVDGTIHIPELDDKSSLSASLGHHVQQISLGRNGELVDHYVVHLTESVDGSGPTIQTAFIPAVSGGQIFTSGPGGMGIQPIAIIEARSFNMAQGDGSGAQVLSADGGNTILACTQGQLDGSNVSGGSYITVSDGTHIVSDSERMVKTELEDAGMIILSEEGGSGGVTGDMIAGHVIMSEQSCSDHIRSRGQVVEMESVMNGQAVADCTEAGISNGQLLDMGSKKQPIVVINNHGMMVSAGDMVSVEAGGDMMDTALSLFGPQSSAEGYVGGQMVVSDDQTYITCNVDYSTSDHVLDGTS